MSALFKYAYGAAGAALATAILWTAWSVDVAATEALHAREIASMQASLIRQCDVIVERNERIVDDLNKALLVSRDRVNLLKLRHAGKEVPVSKATSGDNGSGDVGASGRDGVPAGALYDFAGRGEEVKARLEACQVWEREVSIE